jgi:hypothetical protein
MEGAGVKDTTAYRIVRQVMDHIYGPDEKTSGKDFVSVYRSFREGGGSWESLMAGDMASVKVLEDVLEDFVQARRLKKIAFRVAFGPPGE